MFFFSAIYLQSYRHGGEEWEVGKAAGRGGGTYGNDEELFFMRDGSGSEARCSDGQQKDPGSNTLRLFFVSLCI